VLLATVAVAAVDLGAVLDNGLGFWRRVWSGTGSRLSVRAQVDKAALGLALVTLLEARSCHSLSGSRLVGLELVATSFQGCVAGNLRSRRSEMAVARRRRLVLFLRRQRRFAFRVTDVAVVVLLRKTWNVWSLGWGAGDAGRFLTRNGSRRRNIAFRGRKLAAASGLGLH
jgi:hypothetical protein